MFSCLPMSSDSRYEGGSRSAMPDEQVAARASVAKPRRGEEGRAISRAEESTEMPVHVYLRVRNCVGLWNSDPHDPARIAAIPAGPTDARGCRRRRRRQSRATRAPAWARPRSETARDDRCEPKEPRAQVDRFPRPWWNHGVNERDGTRCSSACSAAAFQPSRRTQAGERREDEEPRANGTQADAPCCARLSIPFDQQHDHPARAPIQNRHDSWMNDSHGLWRVRRRVGGASRPRSPNNGAPKREAGEGSSSGSELRRASKCCPPYIMPAHGSGGGAEQGCRWCRRKLVPPGIEPH